MAIPAIDGHARVGSLAASVAGNVRKTGVKTGIDELAASIAAHGLLQNLQVRPVPDGKYQVVAGARRLAALKLLAKRKEVAKDVEIGCNVLAAEDDAESPRKYRRSQKGRDGGTRRGVAGRYRLAPCPASWLTAAASGPRPVAGAGSARSSEPLFMGSE
jgi:hypothetical protein